MILGKDLMGLRYIFFTEINFEKWRKYGIIGVMKNNGITEYFEEVEITKEYDGYYYSISEAITIVILGSICGLKNISQIHQWAESDRIQEF